MNSIFVPAKVRSQLYDYELDTARSWKKLSNFRSELGGNFVGVMSLFFDDPDHPLMRILRSFLRNKAAHFHFSFNEVLISRAENEFLFIELGSDDHAARVLFLELEQWYLEHAPELRSVLLLGEISPNSDTSTARLDQVL